MLKKVVCSPSPASRRSSSASICEVFGIDRSDSGRPDVRFRDRHRRPGPVRTSLGFDMHIAGRA